MANTHLSLKEFNTLYPNKTITDYQKIIDFFQPFTPSGFNNILWIKR